MLPVPSHLIRCTSPCERDVAENDYTGNITCTCGSDAFCFHHTGGTHECDGATIPCVTEIDGEYFLRIVAVCWECGNQHLLLDKDYHGWNGSVCRQEAKCNRPRPSLTPWPCRACGAFKFRGEISVYGEDLETAVAESNGMLNESNWQDGFGWIGIDLHCIACGDDHSSWVSYETM